jgi:hypothetical protein
MDGWMEEKQFSCPFPTRQIGWGVFLVLHITAIFDELGIGCSLA